ncbi:unnamed protein product [Mesocestoides corti]|uniref:Amino acid transporter n=2 Tax=Mesocestoides corti TaxID=53468 RepID=A0A0R3U5J6_MESCO|nr:unnamed protein product [Mesocestoides corti]
MRPSQWISVRELPDFTATPPPAWSRGFSGCCMARDHFEGLSPQMAAVANVSAQRKDSRGTEIMSATHTEGLDVFEGGTIEVPAKKKKNFFVENWFMITTIIGVVIGFGVGFGIQKVGISEAGKIWIGKLDLLCHW